MEISKDLHADTDKNTTLRQMRKCDQFINRVSSLLKHQMAKSTICGLWILCLRQDSAFEVSRALALGPQGSRLIMRHSWSFPVSTFTSPCHLEQCERGSCSFPPAVSSINTAGLTVDERAYPLEHIYIVTPPAS